MNHYVLADLRMMLQEEGVSQAEMEQLLRQEMEERAFEQEEEEEAPYMEQPAMPEQEAEDMALINYLYR